MPRHIVPNAQTLTEYVDRTKGLAMDEALRNFFMPHLRDSVERLKVFARIREILEDIDPDRCVTWNTRKSGIIKYFFNADYSRNIFVNERLQYSICYSSKARAKQAFDNDRISWKGMLQKGETPP
jgi:hypothetical protein